MCGIIGYSGSGDACAVVLSALAALEYRGYDSAGAAFWEHGGVTLVKRQGRLARLEEALAAGKHDAHCGIGHTRWATHGRPTDVNAHPHRSGRVTLVHNGIIENYASLRERLSRRGVSFLSQTDTETAAALLDSLYAGDPVRAIAQAAELLEGSFAFAILFSDRPGEVYGVRRGSPLIAARDDAGAYIASDLPAILPHTNRYYLLEEGEIACLTPAGISFRAFDGAVIQKEEKQAAWSVESARKDGYDTFMRKEIDEQPRALHDTVASRVRNGLPCWKGELPDGFFRDKTKLTITACGTAYHAGMIGKALIERLARIPVEVEIASELRYRDPIFGENEAALIISQSGETADTLAALRLCRERGIPTVAIVNVVGSSIAREADYCLHTYAGPEISVASTKAYSVQVGLLELMAISAAMDRGMTADEARGLTAQLLAAIDRVPEVLAKAPELLAYAACFRDTQSLFYIGRGLDHAMAMEGSLKLKEISYIHSEAYAAGELKHGTISLIVEGTPVIALATQRALLPKTISNVREVQARGAKVLLITVEGFDVGDTEGMDVFRLPDVGDAFAPIVSVVTLQLLAAGAAAARGCDVDKPRNLAKSVTVE